MWSRRQFLLAGGAALATPLGLGCTSAGAATRARGVAFVTRAQPTIEGAGVHLSRAIGGRPLPLLDPFLLLDEIHSERPEDYLPGFPTHPHRGFETVTYVLEGAVEHGDSLGNQGRLGAGAVQWMTAGHGIVHSEMPGQREGGMWMLQLWVNLPARAKMMRPRYQDLAPARIVATHLDDAAVRLVAGTLGGARGPVEGIEVAPQLMEVAFAGRGRATVPVPLGHAAFVYVLGGTVRIGAEALGAGQLAVLGRGDALPVRSDGAGRFLLVSARPIGEPIARRGPFVMNTEAELQQAIADYRSGQLTRL